MKLIKRFLKWYVGNWIEILKEYLREGAGR